MQSLKGLERSPTQGLLAVIIKDPRKTSKKTDGKMITKWCAFRTFSTECTSDLDVIGILE